MIKYLIYMILAFVVGCDLAPVKSEYDKLLADNNLKILKENKKQIYSCLDDRKLKLYFSYRIYKISRKKTLYVDDRIYGCISCKESILRQQEVFSVRSDQTNLSEIESQCIREKLKSYRFELADFRNDFEDINIVLDY